MSTISILIESIQKSFGSRHVLNHVSLSVPEGKTTALLGRNGAGKTTLIRILLGLLPADSGRVQMLGIDPTIDPLKLRSQIGYLAEDQTMYPWMTPIELCRFLAPFYPTWEMKVANDYLDRFSIPHHGRIHTLSKGQSVKLGLVLALAHRPQVLILDDPAMGLDPISRKEFNREIVDHLQASGSTVLYSSHLLDEVEAVADSIAILDQGTIVRTGTTEDLREDVKQVFIPAEAIDDLRQPACLLDVKRYDDRIAIIIDHAKTFTEYLSAVGIEHEVVNLRLDEIFEAFVIGRSSDWPAAREESLSMSE